MMLTSIDSTAKKPDVPSKAAVKSILPLKLLARQAATKNSACKKDMSFLKDVAKKDDTPEFNGYNTALRRKQGQSLEPKTNAVHQPVINMKPSDLDTMMTAMIRAQQLAFNTGQNFLVLPCDQQLYRVALDDAWTYPDRIPGVVLKDLVGCML